MVVSFRSSAAAVLLAWLSFLILHLLPNCHALQNLIPKQFGANFLGSSAKAAGPRSRQTRTKLEDELLEAIRRQQRRRGDDNNNDSGATIDALIAQLEAAPFSIPNPAIAPEIYGQWRLLYTTNKDNTSSPIQRKAIDTEQFPIYQDIVVDEAKQQLLVKQIVQFSSPAAESTKEGGGGAGNKLSVDAIASTAAYPLEELTARQTDGTVFGINILGVSKTGKEAQPAQANQRIDFVFDEGYFDLGGALKIPYPVPFRLPILRDWVKGWIDITYLSDRLRISRGNKGTTFVLMKENNQASTAE